MELPSPGAMLGTAVRFGALVGLVLALGSIAFRELVLTRVDSPTWPGAIRRLATRAAWVGAVGTVVALVAHLGTLSLQLSELSEPGTPITTDLVTLVVWRTTWGRLWIAHGLLLVVLWRAFMMGRNDLRAAWLAGSGAAAGIAVVRAFGSHASGTGSLAPLTVTADAVHLMAAGAWAGGLAVLFVTALWPRSADTSDPDEIRDDVAVATLVPRLVRAFSPVALWGAGALVLTGAIGAIVHLTRPADLWQTGWGTTLVIKLVFVALVAVLGAINWRRNTPQLGSRAADLTFRNTVWYELTAMMLVLLATGVLVAMELP